MEYPLTNRRAHILDNIDWCLKRLGLAADARDAIMKSIVRHTGGDAGNPVVTGLADYPVGGTARYLHQVALQRNERLGAPVVQEGAWHMLLDLFASTEEGRSISVTSLCLASGTPQTTALRHIDNMVSWGIILRHRDSSDGRRTFLALSDRARAHMREVVLDHSIPRHGDDSQI